MISLHMVDAVPPRTEERAPLLPTHLSRGNDRTWPPPPTQVPRPPGVGAGKQLKSNKCPQTAQRC